MRKIITLAVLCSFFQIRAQDSIPIRQQTDDKHFSMFFGGGAAINNGFEINSYLEKNDIVPLEKAEFNLMVGLIYFSDDIDVELMYDMFVNGQSNETTKNRTIANGIKLRSQWQIFRLKKCNIGAGLNFGYSHRKLSLYWKDHVVDFNNLGEGIQGNQLTMKLERGTFGPSVSARFKDINRNDGDLKLTLSYEIGLNKKPWQPEFFELQNNITEAKVSQVLLNVILIL